MIPCRHEMSHLVGTYSICLADYSSRQVPKRQAALYLSARRCRMTSTISLRNFRDIDPGCSHGSILRICEIPC